MVQRRPDGIVQIRRRPAWRALLGFPSAVLLLFAAFLLLIALLAAALVRHPGVVLAVGGVGAGLGLLARFASSARPAQEPRAAPARWSPPHDAA